MFQQSTMCSRKMSENSKRGLKRRGLNSQNTYQVTPQTHTATKTIIQWLIWAAFYNALLDFPYLGWNSARSCILNTASRHVAYIGRILEILRALRAKLVFCSESSWVVFRDAHSETTLTFSTHVTTTNAVRRILLSKGIFNNARVTDWHCTPQTTF